MKILLVLSMLIMCNSLFAQKDTPVLPIVDGKINYTGIVIDSTQTKHELYIKAREWFAKTYNSSKDVIQMEDSTSGKIIGKALLKVYHKAMKKDHPSGYINYTISIYMKDGRYKYEVTSFYHTGSGLVPDYGACEDMINTKMKTMGISYQKTFNYYLFQLDNAMKALVKDLENSMNGSRLEKVEDEW